MSVIFVHPYKHHSYHTLIGIKESSKDVEALYGYYDKGDILDCIIKGSKYRKKIKGYRNDKISNITTTNFRIKLFYLWHKINPEKNYDIFIDNFEKWAINYVKYSNIVHVFQDYCNLVIREAYENNKIIVYEEIQPPYLIQKEVLNNEIYKWGYSKEYVENRFPEKKINEEIENLNMASIIIVASEATENAVKKIVPNKNIYRIPYGAKIGVNHINRYKCVREEKEINDKLKVLYIGSLNLIKGVQYIIEAAKRMRNENVEFTFVGLPRFEEDKKLVIEINSLANAKYIPSIPHSEINNIYLKNDVFIFQGLCEGFGMVTLEAMSCGMPCIVSEGAKGIITNGVDGFINNNGDVEKIIENIKKLSNDREMLREMSKNAFHNIESYPWERYENEISEIYKLL